MGEPNCDRELMVRASELQRHNKRHWETPEQGHVRHVERIAQKTLASLARTPCKYASKSEGVGSIYGGVT